MPKLGDALNQDDLTMVVEAIADEPLLTITPLSDGTHTEFPLDRALRLNCQPMIIEILEHNSTNLVETNEGNTNQENNHLTS